MDLITSRDNPHIKQLAALLSRKKERDLSGCFGLEGLRLCVDAAESGVEILTLFLTPQAAGRYPEADKVARTAQRTLWLDENLAARVGDTKSPQGVFAICKKLDNRRSAAKIKDGGCYILVSSLQDPGNLGSILRTAEAFALDGIFLSGDCPDIYSPKILRGSMGGIFRLPIAVSGNLMEEISSLRQRGIPVYAAALTDEALPVVQADFSAGGAVVVGNEGHGLSEDIVQACTRAVVIPMNGRADSLGVAAAAGILMWEMRRNEGRGKRC